MLNKLLGVKPNAYPCDSKIKRSYCGATCNTVGDRSWQTSYYDSVTGKTCKTIYHSCSC
ncbi:hypothetical protein [Alkalihalobacillus sp. CinArs1]|uniref:hypothetical protein n=1 Tax=Alkalihalobacillus sp. CinArs1 TaxID=2995314 RepID=UPI0022DDEF62|nr:hypothetical protein [Alkalihalobacillus sp. CinArs1]